MELLKIFKRKIKNKNNYLKIYWMIKLKNKMKLKKKQQDHIYLLIKSFKNKLLKKMKESKTLKKNVKNKNSYIKII
jgi:hypothetical protein